MQADQPSPKVLKCARLLARKKLTIAFAESATAGRMCAEFALTPQSGKILVGGIVCYDASLKEQLLNVPLKLVEKYTPESAEVTSALVYGLKELIKADVHVAVTGLISSGGSETPAKPVGTMFIHTLFRDQELVMRKVFKGSPSQIILKSIDHTATELLSIIEKITTIK